MQIAELGQIEENSVVDRIMSGTFDLSIIFQPSFSK